MVLVVPSAWVRVSTSACAREAQARRTNTRERRGSIESPFLGGDVCRSFKACDLGFLLCPARTHSAVVIHIEAGALIPIIKDLRDCRSEEHTSELQSQFHLVCR